MIKVKETPLMKYEDSFHPLKLYGILRKFDIDKPTCKEICRFYTHVMYIPIKDYLEYGIKINGLEEKTNGS